MERPRDPEDRHWVALADAEAAGGSTLVLQHLPSPGFSNDPRHSHSGPPIFEKLWRARSPLYRSRFLRPRYHFAAFFEIYKMYIPSHRSKFNFYCKISDEILLIFSKKSTFHIKFDVFRVGFDENSSKFQQFSENCEEYSRFHSF